MYQPHHMWWLDSTTCHKTYLKQQLKIQTDHVQHYRSVYRFHIFRTDYSEADIRWLVHFWNDSEQARRRMIMALLCF